MQKLLPFPIIDAHMHIWDSSALSYPWLQQVPLLNRPYSLSNYRTAASDVDVERVVFVEALCENAVQELDWVSRQAMENDVIGGIVASAPLENGEAVLPLLQAHAAKPRVKGVRVAVRIDEARRRVDEKFVLGVKQLAKVGFSFDFWNPYGEHDIATGMVRQCPEVQFMLNHIGGPDIVNQRMEPWRTHIRELATLPNAYCKLSSVPTFARKPGWKREELRPYIDHVLDCFGFERTVFGSDWPHALLSVEYTPWLEIMLWALEACTDDQRRQYFHDTAERFYRL